MCMWGGKATCVGGEKYVYVGREGHMCGRGEVCVCGEGRPRVWEGRSMCMWGGKATCVGGEKYVYGRGEECVGGLRRCRDMRREIQYQIMHSIKKFSWTIIVVSLVAWFTLVLEANCIRQPVSLLFPPLLFILKQGKEEETT